MSVCSAYTSPLSCSRFIAICHPIYSILKNSRSFRLRTVEAHRNHNYRFCIDLTAESDELVSTEAVLVIIHPHPVRPSVSFLLRTDSPFPVVLRDITAARPTETCRMKILYCLEDIRTETAKRLSCHCRKSHLIYLEGSVFCSNRKICISAEFSYRKFNIKLLPLVSRCTKNLFCNKFSISSQSY